MAYLLRLVLPDRPGMLGAVATAIGEAGGDILSVDVVERGPDGAVDDLLVELPPGALADGLITSAQSVQGVEVESLRPHLGAPDLHSDLELVDALAAVPARALAVLAEGAPRVFRAGWAVIVEQDAGLVAASHGAPDVSDLVLSWLPLRLARPVEAAERWVPRSWLLLGTELAAAPVGIPAMAILLGRPGGPTFRRSEVLRLAHLAGLAALVRAAD